MKSRKVNETAHQICEVCFEFIKMARQMTKEVLDVEMELLTACNNAEGIYSVSILFNLYVFMWYDISELHNVTSMVISLNYIGATFPGVYNPLINSNK